MNYRSKEQFIFKIVKLLSSNWLAKLLFVSWLYRSGGSDSSEKPKSRINDLLLSTKISLSDPNYTILPSWVISSRSYAS
jgi:hypothetical protein